MIASALRSLVPVFLLPLTMGHAGGWAVITVDAVPDVVEAGKAVTMTYTVRQHGVTLLDRLNGQIDASSGRLTARGTVSETSQAGRYTATLTLPSDGDWSVTIRSGFGNSNLKLLPLTAVTHGSGLTRPVSHTERGRRLFVSKGCVTCHAQMDVGPNLDGKRFDATYLAGFLANPRAPQPGKAAMPNLGLEQTEIASLVAYLNSDRQPALSLR
jgi:cytochrome c2